MRLATRVVCSVVLALTGMAAGQDQPDAPATVRPGRSAPVKPAAPSAPTTPAAPATPSKPTTATPAAPAAPMQPGVKREAPALGPYLARSMPKDWTLTISVRLNSDSADEKDTQTDATGKSFQTPHIAPFEFETMTFVFPVMPETGASLAYPKRATATMKFEDRLIADSFEMMQGHFHSGVQMMMLKSDPTVIRNIARQVYVDIEMPMTCWRSQFDEQGAAAIPWPTGAWPIEAAASLGSQMYVDIGVDDHMKLVPYDDKPVDAYLKQALTASGITDAKKATPLRVAKSITRAVWEQIQPSGDGLTFRARTQELSGVVLQSPATTITQHKGTEHDLTVLMAALMRKAGLPTRTVIGWDIGGNEVKFLKNGKKQNRLRSWVEFCLYDEKANTVNWIPIDVARMRKLSSRAAAEDKEWKFFGTHDEMDSITPFALQFHPPTDVVSYGSAAFWGWFVTPMPPEHAYTALVFRAAITAKRGDAEEDPTKKKDEKKRLVPPRGR